MIRGVGEEILISKLEILAAPSLAVQFFWVPPLLVLEYIQIFGNPLLAQNRHTIHVRVVGILLVGYICWSLKAVSHLHDTRKNLLTDLTTLKTFLSACQPSCCITPLLIFNYNFKRNCHTCSTFQHKNKQSFWGQNDLKQNEILPNNLFVLREKSAWFLSSG